MKENVIDDGAMFHTYEHQLRAKESGTCQCGMVHDSGDVLWGGLFNPTDMGEHDPTTAMRNIHSVEIAYNRKP